MGIFNEELIDEMNEQGKTLEDLITEDYIYTNMYATLPKEEIDGLLDQTKIFTKEQESDKRIALEELAHQKELKRLEREYLDKKKAKEREYERVKREKRRDKLRYKQQKNSRLRDGRQEVRQGSLRWTTRKAANLATLGLIKQPKTERADNYRNIFLRRNPGFLKRGLYFCMYCGRPVGRRGMQVDHIRPVNKGGVNSLWNLGPACSKCNQKKSDKVGSWVIRGRIGKFIWATLQTLSNCTMGILTGDFRPTDAIKMAGIVLVIGAIIILAI